MISVSQKSKYENTELVSQIQLADTKTNAMFNKWKIEGLANWKRLGGHILSTTDKAKLQSEFRPDFEYNLLLPFILQLVGNFKSSQSKVEAVGRGRDDFQKAKLINQVLDYIHYTENDLLTETAKAYTDALISRIGWLVMDWTTKKDPLGNVQIKRYDWRRMKFDPTFTQSDLSDCDWLMDSGFYTPEEIKMTWAMEDENLWNLIDEEAKNYIGEDTVSRGKLATMAHRLTGALLSYAGETVGYDHTSQTDQDIVINGSVFNQASNTFKVNEFHERRSEIRFMIRDKQGVETDITEFIDAKSRTEYDNDKLQLIRQQFKGYNVVPVKKELIWQTTVIPAFNMVLEDKKYEIQNGLYKYIPVFCFDFDIEPMEYKSYIDHMKDPVSSYNLRRNTELTILMRSAHSETWYEEDALGEYEDAFTDTNEIGGNKKVKKDAIRLNKIKQITSNVNFSGLAGYAQEDKQNLKEISGIQANSMGQLQSANESGRAVDSRVAQTNVMQLLPHENAMRQLKLVGKYTISMVQKFMTMPRVFRITNDTQEEEEVRINIQTIEGVLNDVTKGKFDIKLSIAPFGKEAQQREFQEAIALNQTIAAINPAYADAKMIVRASNSRYSDEILKHINQVDQQSAQNAQEQIETDKKLIQGEIEKVINTNAKLMAETEKLEMETDKLEVETSLLEPQFLLENAYNKQYGKEIA